MNRLSVLISVFLESPVGTRAVAMNKRSWTDGRFNKRHQVFVVTTINPLNADSSESFGLQHLHCNGNQDLGGVALAANCTDRIYSLGKCQIGFIDLNLPLSSLGTRYPVNKHLSFGVDVFAYSICPAKMPTTLNIFMRLALPLKSAAVAMVEP